MKTFVRFVAVTLGAQAWLTPSPGAAQCTDFDVTAVALVNDIHHDPQSPSLGHVRITPVQDATNPSDAEILAAIEDFYGFFYVHEWSADAGPYELWIAQPLDIGTATIVDSRSAEILFAGGIHWAGTGPLFRPTGSTHAVAFVANPPAGPPTSVVTLPSAYWGGGGLPTPEELTDEALAFLRGTDLVHAFEGCGSYAAVGYLWTPSVGDLVIDRAVEVLVITGRLPVEYSPPSAVESESWGRVKAIYRGH